MELKKPMCLSCKHSIQNSSCGPCSDKGSQVLENIGNELGIEIVETEQEQVNSLKLSCKIINRYPEDNESINPFDCKYHLPSALRFF